MTAQLLASEIYALSQGAKCEGNDECHWCSAPCKREAVHDDPPPLPGQRRSGLARRPGNSYICKACWLWKRLKLTVNYLSGGFKDGQSPAKQSCLVTEREVLTIPPLWSWNFATRAKLTPLLYSALLKPPLRFFLSLLDNDKTVNHLQLCIANCNDEIRADTTLKYTLNNIEHTYTIYELEEALKSNDATGTEPGVQVIVKLFGPHEVMHRTEEKRGAGRPPAKDTTEKAVRKKIT